MRDAALQNAGDPTAGPSFPFGLVRLALGVWPGHDPPPSTPGERYRRRAAHSAFRA
eukprot:CAMPEP_0172591190 /NCGR_PEP_ID=MMETSP1068-20121228/9872_1 /TAXON_ID=35684 /ORGANISM="Pseudopedinella elastica, Strain CCMP716" /LENGTH=55 /DNA_ID=CAMNT_0013387465 /DNA_START=8 /DNA_END=171 /DNA_ORIENTATION=+